MTEKLWNRMLILSLALHLVVIAGFSVPFGKGVKKLDPFRQSYSVGLVGDIGGGATGGGVTREVTPKRPEKVEKQTPQPAVKKPVPAKVKPQVQPKENDVRSIAPKRLPAKETPPTPSKDEVKRVDEKIREMRRQAEQQEASGYGKEGREGTGRGAGSALGTGTGEGGGRPIDPALYKYLLSIREKIENAWHIPFSASARKNLEARVTIRIRRDGRITDISMDKRSGNRIFDESVLRVLRAIDPLPSIPPAVKEEPLEVELLLKPEGVS